MRRVPMHRRPRIQIHRWHAGVSTFFGCDPYYLMLPYSKSNIYSSIGKPMWRTVGILSILYPMHPLHTCTWMFECNYFFFLLFLRNHDVPCVFRTWAYDGWLSKYQSNEVTGQKLVCSRLAGKWHYVHAHTLVAGFKVVDGTLTRWYAITVCISYMWWLQETPRRRYDLFRRPI